MAIFPRAGQKAQQQDMYNIPALVANYFELQPSADKAEQAVQFGTSGHRGSADKVSFNRNHILAIVQAIVNVRKQKGITGPLFIGKDTHALSEPAFTTALEVLAANQVHTIIQQGRGYTPTPGISHAILCYNKNHAHKADGIVITPSHNPPQDGGIKYNPTHGGPAEAELTDEMQKQANALIAEGLTSVKTISAAQAFASDYVTEQEMIQPYVDDLVNIIDIKAIQESGLKLGVDPLGGSGIEYWKRIAQTYQLNLELTNDNVDPSFRFMSLDRDGVIRMDCSSPYAMAGLLAHKDKYDLAFANDPDYDRHGIVTPAGLMNPNHYLAVCIDYLFRHRPQWGKNVAVGKTLVSSALIDRVVADLGRNLCEVPVGFKWFVDGLFSGKLGLRFIFTF